MNDKKYGLWIELNKMHVPNIAGTYYAYKCIYNKNEFYVEMKELIHTEYSSNINRSIENSEELKKTRLNLQKNYTICYKFSLNGMANHLK